MVGADKKWVDAMRAYLADGNGHVPVFYATSGVIDADRTMEFFMGYFGIKKAIEEKTNA